MTRTTTLIAAGLAVLPIAALAATTVETFVASAIAPWIVAGIMGVAGAAVGLLASTSERFAAPARAKSPEERTLLEKAAIEADRKIDEINIGIIEIFATRWVNAHINQVLGSPVFDPMRQAEQMVDGALEGFRQRNPEIAAATGIGKLSMQGILAGAIGAARRDELAAILGSAGAPPLSAR